MSKYTQFKFNLGWGDCLDWGVIKPYHYSKHFQTYQISNLLVIVKDISLDVIMNRSTSKHFCLFKMQ